jgi:hypothetical protein
MRGILIDPYKNDVSQVEFSGGPDDLCRLLHAKAVHAVRVGPLDMLWMDEGGFGTAGRPVFRLGEAVTPFCGVGLILGVDNTGAQTSTTLPLAKALKTVRWTDYESTGAFHQGGVAPGDDAEFYDFIIRAGLPRLRRRPTQDRT